MKKTEETSFVKGVIKQGRKKPNLSISKETQIEIGIRFIKGELGRELSEEYNVSEGTISRYIHNNILEILQQSGYSCDNEEDGKELLRKIKKSGKVGRKTNLTVEDEIRITMRHKAGETLVELGKEFGIPPVTIHHFAVRHESVALDRLGISDKFSFIEIKKNLKKHRIPQSLWMRYFPKEVRDKIMYDLIHTETPESLSEVYGIPPRCIRTYYRKTKFKTIKQLGYSYEQYREIIKNKVNRISMSYLGKERLRIAIEYVESNSDPKVLDKWGVSGNTARRYVEEMRRQYK